MKNYTIFILLILFLASHALQSAGSKTVQVIIQKDGKTMTRLVQIRPLKRTNYSGAALLSCVLAAFFGSLYSDTREHDHRLSDHALSLFSGNTSSYDPEMTQGMCMIPLREVLLVPRQGDALSHAYAQETQTCDKSDYRGLSRQETSMNTSISLVDIRKKYHEKMSALAALRTPQ